jgi:hypothetical protein
MIARRFTLANEATLALALAALGCSPQDPGSDADETGNDDGSNGIPFELVSASLDATGQVVILQFSEPVASVDAVEPSDFRISYALPTEVCGDNGCTPETSYWDPHFFVDEYLGYQYGSGDRFEVDLIGAGEQANTVSLHFGTPLKPYLCEYVAPYEDEYDFLFVHFAPGDIPLESADGESLAAIGAEFVHDTAPVFTAEGDFPNLDPKISIPCSL